MSSERLDVTHSHEEFSCPNIRGCFCGWSVKFVRGRRSLSYSRMIGTKIVVQICWTPIVLLFFAFFPVGVTWLLLFSNLFAEVVGGVACFFRVSCQTLRFFCMVQGLKCFVPHVPNDDPHTIPFSLKAGACVRCRISVSFLRGWQLLWCVLPNVGTEIRVKFIGWSWWNESVCDATTFAYPEAIRLCKRFFLISLKSAWSWVRLSCVTFCVSPYDLSSLLFVRGSPKDTHWRNRMTHVLWKVGCDQLA